MRLIWASDLALMEYGKLVHSLDPSAIPALVSPKSYSVSNILHSTPALADGSDLPTPPLTSPSSTGEAISNLLVGQRGVHQLFNDFTTTLTAKEKAVHQLTVRVEEMQHSLGVMRDQLTAETGIRVQAQTERDKALRDDASAAKVVERYMTFTQKTHATMYMHLDNLRIRSSSTQSTLRKDLIGFRSRLEAETERSRRLREAIDEMSESLSREAAGRRREVALRLKALSAEEKRERKVEAWLDRVRRARDGAEGAVLEPDLLEGLVDEGVEAVSPDADRADKSRDKPRTWRSILSKKLAKEDVDANGAESSLARVLLAEELVKVLVLDLQEETERRMELERQRVEWLARDAVDGVEATNGDTDGQMLFDAENQDEEDRGARGIDGSPSGLKAQVEAPARDTEILGLKTPPLPPPLPDSSPLIAQVRELFLPLTERQVPLQKTLHDLSISLVSLRTSLPLPPHDLESTSPKQTKKASTILPSLMGANPMSDPVLINLLDSIHEVIEDARVDVEIAAADEERVYRGFEALLGVGAGSGAVQGKDVMSDARDYVNEKLVGERNAKLAKRVEDVEHDLVLLKRTVHEVDGMEVDKSCDEDAEGVDGSGSGSGSKNVWCNLDLRTITTASGRSIDTAILSSRRQTTALLSSVGSVGRSFSASVIGTPRKVSSLAGGLYHGTIGSPRSKNSTGESDSLLEEEDDVE